MVYWLQPTPTTLGATMTQPLVVRQGASVRTADELNLLFIEDVAACLNQPVYPLGHRTWDDDRPSLLSPDGFEVYNEASHALTSGRWIEDSDLSQELSDLAHQVECASGLYVTWDDGYVIYPEDSDVCEVCNEVLTDGERVFMLTVHPFISFAHEGCWKHDLSPDVRVGTYDESKEHHRFVADFDGHICVDCLVFVANGDTSGMDEETEARVTGPFAMLSDYWVTSDDEGSFSWSSCDRCGTTLGGVRYGAWVIR